MKARVILDIAFLGHAHEEKKAQRGVQRVVRHLFEGLQNSAWPELSFVATSHISGAYDFLGTAGLNPEERLYHLPGQLSRSRTGRKITKSVHETMENRNLSARIRRRVMANAATFFLRGESRILPEWLDQADIFHSPHAPFGPSVQAHPRIKKFITCHDFIPLKNPEYFASDAQPFMAAILASLKPENFAFCVSETTRNDVLNLSRMLPERVFVTPLAADREIFHPVTGLEALIESRRKFQLGSEPYFLALSAHDRHKNFSHLIECFGSLVEAGELAGYNLVIAGPNPGRNPEAREAMAKFSKLKRRIIIAGFVPDEQIAAIYSGARAFLFPSLAEGFGLPPLEAMQCGLPVLASNTTSIPEVVGDAGLLLSPTDKDGWCQAMIRIAQDDQLRKELAERSISRARHFTWERFMDETLRGYRKSLET